MALVQLVERSAGEEGHDPGPLPEHGVKPHGARRVRGRWLRAGRGLVPTRAEGIAALLSAGLFAVAFPPFQLVVPVLVCLVPVAVHVARSADRGGRASGAARTGFWFGAIGYGVNLYWIAVALLLYTRLALLGYVGAIAWLAPVVAAAMTVLFAARRLTGWPLVVLLPLTWTASELVLNYLGDLSFPWLPLGLGVVRVPLLAQAADLSGVRGVSFWIAAVNGALADAWLLWGADRSRALRRVALAAGIIAAAAGYGAARMRSIRLVPLARVAVVQPDIPQVAKLTVTDPTAHVGRLTAMTRALLEAADSASAPELVMWPEAALDRFLWQYPAWRDSLRAAVAPRPAPLLTGVLDSSDPWLRPLQYWNAALVTDPRGVVGTEAPYRKQFLVPVVERVPFLNPEWFTGMQYFGGFARGTSDVPTAFPFGRGGILICYEAIFPQLARAYAQHGAVVLLNITNDAWFQRSSAPYQHWAHLALRAIETRLPVVRAANTGISGWVDPLGRVRAATPLFEPRAEIYAVERVSGATSPYIRAGDWVGGASLAVTIGFLIGAAARRWGGERRGAGATAGVGAPPAAGASGAA